MLIVHELGFILSCSDAAVFKPHKHLHSKYGAQKFAIQTFFQKFFIAFVKPSITYDYGGHIESKKIITG